MVGPENGGPGASKPPTSEDKAAQSGQRGESPFKGLAAGYMMIASVLVGGAIGYAIDHHWQTTPWWSLGMSIAFLIVGFYHIVKEYTK